MVEQSLFAGPNIRRIRRREGLTQAAMAATLGISASYLNLIERNQRPLSARLLLAMAQHFDFDPRSLGSHEEAGGVDGLRRRLADTLFDDLGIDREEVVEWLNAAPQAAVAFARLYDRAGSTFEGEAQDPTLLARREIERWRNHFADLDAAAEELADELRLSDGEIGVAMAERLRRRHQLSLRILPAEVMPDHLRRLDLHARQLQLAEMLDPARLLMTAQRARIEIEVLGQRQQQPRRQRALIALDQVEVAGRNAKRRGHRRLGQPFAAANAAYIGPGE